MIDRHGNVREAAISDRSVREIVEKRAQAAGLNRDRYSGHSPRASLATAASAAGVSQRFIMDQGANGSVAIRAPMRKMVLGRRRAARDGS